MEHRLDSRLGQSRGKVYVGLRLVNSRDHDGVTRFRVGGEST